MTLIIFLCTAHVHVWKSDYGGQPCLLQPSAGHCNQHGDGGGDNDDGNADDDENNPYIQKAAPLPALDLAIVLKELTIAGFNVYRSLPHAHCPGAGSIGTMDFQSHCTMAQARN